jgi:drug/metabolite transporter (DMT)-like permease
MSSDFNRPSLGQYVLLFVLAAVWGSSFILMKVGLFGWTGSPGSSPILSGVQLGLLRISLAGLVLLPFAVKRLKKWNSRIWGALLVNGFIGSLTPAVLFALAQTRLPSATAGMLNALSPLWTLVIALVLYGTVVRKRQAMGLVLGFVGAVGLMSLKDGSGDVHWGAAVMLVCATACYGFSINVVRNRLSELDPMAISAMALSMTAIPSSVGFVVTGGVGALQGHPEGSLAFLAVAVLAVVGTAVALVVFNALIQKTNALFASSVTYVIPLFALFWGWMDGEWIGWAHAAYGAVILSGVRLVARG